MAIYLGVLSLIVTAMVVYNFPGASKGLKTGTLVFSCLLLALVSGFRYDVGTDYMNYMWMYEDYAYLEPITIYEKPGLHIIGRIAAFIFDHHTTWFVMMALITVGLYFFGIKKYSINVTFSVFLFIFLGVWHGSFNTVKQHAAAAIFFASLPFLYKRDFLSWMFSCILATFFHEAALVMIPMYFIITFEHKYMPFFIIALGVAAFVGKDIIIFAVDVLKANETSMSDTEIINQGVGVIRTIVSCAPVFFYCIFCKPSDYIAHEMLGENVKDFEHKTDKKFNCLLNLAIFSAVMSVALSSSVYFIRLLMFFDMFNVLFIPYLVKPFKKEKKILFTVLILVLYCTFWWVDITKASTVNYQFVFMIKE